MAVKENGHLESSEVSQRLEALDSVSRHSFGEDEAARIQALEKARALCARLETPWECLARMIWLDPATSVATRIAIDSEILGNLGTHDSPKSISGIAKATGVEPVLLGRLLRFLSATQIIQEVDRDQFASTELSDTLRGPASAAGFLHLCTHVWPVFSALPQYLKKTDYQSPRNPFKGPWQFGKDTKLSFFEWVSTHAEEGAAFNRLIGASREQQHLNWTTIYPVKRLAEQEDHADQTSNEAPVIVDVGGGVGTEMENLRQALLPAPTHMIVQDLPTAVEQGKTQYAHLEFTPHDFFTAQPVHGARAYFLQAILHDWPDEKAREILLHLKPAMRHGYSTLLVCDHVIPDQAIPPVAGAMDIVMMGLLCAQERTESDFRQLLLSAGFRIRHIWRASHSAKSVIEAELHE